MESDITVETLPLLGICNLCLSDGIVQNMFTVQKSNEVEETYGDMLLKCFGIEIASMKLPGDTKQMVCESCIAKLKDALEFKYMAEASLKSLERTHEDMKKEEISNDFEDGFDFEDDQVIADIMVKKEELLEEIVKRPEQKIKRKSKISNKKLKIPEHSNAKSLSADDFLNMLERGLFPFKIHKKCYTCAICPEKNSSLDHIKDHFLQHSEKYIQIAFRKASVVSRCRFCFGRNLNFKCKLCSTEVLNYEGLKSHLEFCYSRGDEKKIDANLPFKLEKDQLDCPICKKTFLNFVSLNTHMNLHYPNYICEGCGKAFASKTRLRAHMRTHEIGVFPCKICGAVFDKVTKGENHVSKEHKAGIRYSCKKCNLSLSSFYARQKHLADVHNEVLKKYKCNACSQSYVTPGHLSSHVRRDHLNERNYKCDKCDLAFYTRNSLNMHMIKHDGKRIHACPVCQKSYQRKKTLKEHMRIHNNDKRFVCPFCGRAFTQKCTLKGHLRVHDRKEIVIESRVTQPLHSI